MQMPFHVKNLKTKRHMLKISTFRLLEVLYGDDWNFPRSNVCRHNADDKSSTTINVVPTTTATITKTEPFDIVVNLVKTWPSSS